jgi:nicotinamide mononucleotide adenylyltransferase
MFSHTVLFALYLFSFPSSLLVFEQARNYLQVETGRYEVIGGFLSPVHDAYGKSSLIPQEHRLSMCEAATNSSKWLSVQQWELKQQGWTTTAETLCKYQEALNRAHLVEGQNALFVKEAGGPRCPDLMSLSSSVRAWPGFCVLSPCLLLMCAQSPSASSSCVALM